MNDGPRFPTDLAAWHKWSAGQHRLRAIKSRFSSPQPPPPVVTYRNSDAPPNLIISVASASPSARAALFAPIPHAGDASIAVISDADISRLLPGWQACSDPWEPLLSSATAVLGDGHYMGLGHKVWSVSRKQGLPYYVSQHGLLTAFAPPLPPGAHLFSWSDQDSVYWTSGRTDVSTTTVGSQLLWQASASPQDPVAQSSPTPITYAGQLHGAELPRWSMTRAALAFCRANGAVYRPHPSERDRLSRTAHAAFVRSGIQLDTDPQPLTEARGGLVSVFSTSVLEAAASGRSAWVDYPSPPPWLSSFWTRYSMHRWGEDPTPPPDLPSEEPAAHITRVVLGNA